jgi:hypothetical protein
MRKYHMAISFSKMLLKFLHFVMCSLNTLEKSEEVFTNKEMVLNFAWIKVPSQDAMVPTVL